MRPRIEKLQKIVEIMKSLGDMKGEAAALQEMARLDMSRCDYDGARQRLVKSWSCCKKPGIGRAQLLPSLTWPASIWRRATSRRQARSLPEALPLFQEMGDRAGEAAILHSLGMIHSQAGEKEKAMESFRDSPADQSRAGR